MKIEQGLNPNCSEANRDNVLNNGSYNKEPEDYRGYYLVYYCLYGEQVERSGDD